MKTTWEFVCNLLSYRRRPDFLEWRRKNNPTEGKGDA
jgi:hypothetical protein